MSNITYKPWIGKKYGKSKYGKLLIIGDSHYFKNSVPENLSEFTCNQIAELDIISSNFHRSILRTFGHNKHQDFWENVAFANAIQSPFSFAAQEPTDREKDMAEQAFKEYLSLTTPDKVIVFSSRLWEHFFNKPGWGNHYDKIDNRWNVRELEYNGGKCKALGIYHPSARKYDSMYFSEVIKSFMHIKKIQE